MAAELVIGALNAVGQALDIAKGLRAAEKHYDAAVWKSQIGDLYDALLDVRGRLQDEREAAILKDAEIADLKSLLDARGNTVVVSGHRYTAHEKDPTKPVGPPFCLRCDTVDHRLVLTVNMMGAKGATCPQCKTEYGTMISQFNWPE